MEDRVEELENENEQLLKQRDTLKKKFSRRLSSMDKSIKKLVDEKLAQADELKESAEACSKLQIENRELQGQIHKLKLNVQVQNLQESSFTLNRSIDQGDSRSSRQNEYAKFLRSTKVVHTDSSCNSRNSKLLQHQQ